MPTVGPALQRRQQNQSHRNACGTGTFSASMTSRRMSPDSHINVLLLPVSGRSIRTVTVTIGVVAAAASSADAAAVRDSREVDCRSVRVATAPIGLHGRLLRLCRCGAAQRWSLLQPTPPHSCGRQLNDNI